MSAWTLPITEQQHREYHAEFRWFCELGEQARKLYNELDTQEGLAILDNNPKRLAQCQRLKRMCRDRMNRRSSKAHEAYEDGFLECFESIWAWERPKFKKPARKH